MAEPVVRFGLTQKAYALMNKVALGDYVSNEEMYTADRLSYIDRNINRYIGQVKVGPPTIMRECNMLVKEDYLMAYTDPFADWLEGQLRVKEGEADIDPNDVGVELGEGYEFHTEITAEGRKKMEEVANDPSAEPDPWGTWLFEFRKERLSVPEHVQWGLAKKGWIKITKVPMQEVDL